MRVLMITASPPYPLHQGGAIRAYGLLHGLHQAGHTVDLLTFAPDQQLAELSETPLADLCEHIATVPAPARTRQQRLRDLLLTPDADIEKRLDSDDMRAALNAHLTRQSYDLVQFEGIEVARYLLDMQQAHPNIPTVYDAFNAEADLQRVIAQIDRADLSRLPNAVYSSLQASRIERFERRVCRAATAVIAVSQEDAALLAPYRQDEQVHIVPSGIFVDDYTRAPDLELKPGALVFTGKMDYRPNVDAMLWFAEKVLPRITEAAPAHLYIVGQRPHPRLDALRGHPHITITSWVPHVQPYLHAAAVYVAPLRMGSGTRLKILEAMAASCALVATPTAAAGLQAAAMQHMRIAQDAEQTAAHVIDLLQHPDACSQLGQQAHIYIRAHYDWSVITPRLLNVYEELGFE